MEWKDAERICRVLKDEFGIEADYGDHAGHGEENKLRVELTVADAERLVKLAMAKAALGVVPSNDRLALVKAALRMVESAHRGMTADEGAEPAVRGASGALDDALAALEKLA